MFLNPYSLILKKKNEIINNCELQKINDKEVVEFITSVESGSKIVNEEQLQAVQRFFKDLDNKNYEFKVEEAEFVIKLIEGTIVNIQGETVSGLPLANKPLKLIPWQKFCIYNILGFYHKKTILRRFKEVFIFIPRKNGKTSFIGALAWALGILSRKSGTKIYIVGDVLKQSLESFTFIKENIYHLQEDKYFKIRDNSFGHTIERKFSDGFMKIEALAGNSDNQDSLNSNIQICDELHAYKTPKKYNVIKEAGKAYANKLCIGISTAGDNENWFCGQRLKYCKKVLSGQLVDEQLFIFIAKADDKNKYDDETEIIKANPSVGYTISLDSLKNDAYQARNDPQQRKDFLAKSLNIFTNSVKAYFDLTEFYDSDEQYNWTLEDLAKLKISWYGGADLSKLHDLTASALYGNYKGVDICITHAFFPRSRAHIVAEENSIPLFGWEDDGNLTMSDTETVLYDDVVEWFCMMREKGFKIRQVGFDRKFANEFFLKMKKKKFKMIDEPQIYFKKSQGFRRIEMKVKNKEFYYLHSEAYEYCVSNVKAVEKVDDAIQYEKTDPTQKIDLFDASVFACMRMIEDEDKKHETEEWLKSK